MSRDDRQVPGWLDNWRGDIEVSQTAAGGWQIIPETGFPILFCPCCNLPFQNARQAKLVADALYPPPPPAG